MNHMRYQLGMADKMFLVFSEDYSIVHSGCPFHSPISQLPPHVLIAGYGIWSHKPGRLSEA